MRVTGVVSDCEALEAIEAHLQRMESRFEGADNPTKEITAARLLEYCWVLQQAQAHIAHTPAGAVQPQDALKFVQETQDRLTVPEIMQIVNLVPTTIVELHTVLGDKFDEQEQEDLLQLIRNTLILNQ